MKIALSTDHAGFEQAKQLKEYLVATGQECVYFGPKEFQPDDDYPDFIFPASQSVASGECDLGIIMGGSGQGEAMVANRNRGVRCAVYYGSAVPNGAVDIEGRNAVDKYEIVRLSRQHNNANMLSLATRFLSMDEMKTVVKIWLETSFSGEERHSRRIEKLDRF